MSTAVSCGVKILMGFLLSTLTLPFNTVPLGVAVLAGSTNGIPFLLIGAVAGAITGTEHAIVYVCAYGATVLMRLFLRLMSEPSQERSEGGGLFEDKLSARVLSGLLVSFVIGIYVLIAEGFRYYDLFGAFFGVACACFGTFAISFALSDGTAEVRTDKGGRLITLVPWIMRGCRAALIIAMIFSARSYSSGVFSLSASLAFFVTLYYARGLGSLASAALGLIFGLAVSPAAAPLFMLAGAVASMVYKISPLSAIISSVLCSSVWGNYIGGVESLLVLSSSASVAGALFYAFHKVLDGASDGEKSRMHSAEGTIQGNVIGAAATRQLADHTDQLKAMSTAFSSLSEIFYNLSDRLRRPSTLDLRRMCDGAFDLYCPGCPERELCWGLEYSSTLEVMNELTNRLHTHGRVDLGCLPEHLKRRCPSTEDIVSEINRSCARMTEAALKTENTEVFALDYEVMARILCDTLDGESDEYKINGELSTAVSSYLEDCGLAGATVVCFGGRRKQIIARGMGPIRAALYSEHLREDVEKLSGYQLTGPIFESGDRFTPPSMIFTARPRISVSCICRAIGSGETQIRTYDFDQSDGTPGNGQTDTQSGEHTEVSPHVTPKGIERWFAGVRENGHGTEDEVHADSMCGDTVNVFVSRKDYFYALISDGMGTGETAAFTSELCSVFLEKMLGAGNSIETSLKMLNGFIRSRSSSSCASECSATIDLLELDLLTGSASFVKSGAAQSYVIRDGAVYRLMSRTVPIGIIRAIDAQRLRMDVRDGDIIIMLSDGITQGSEECTWLTELLTKELEKGSSYEDIAELLIQSSRREAHLLGYEKYDDASVLIITVKEYIEDGK